LRHWSRGEDKSVADYSDGAEESMKVSEIAAWSIGKDGSVADYSNGEEKRIKLLKIGAEERINVSQITVME
jgi:hypothetical protein